MGAGGDGVRTERHEGAGGERAELCRAEHEEEDDEREQEDDRDGTGVDQTAVIDGAVDVGPADGLRGPGTHRGLHGRVNLAVLLGFHVTDHAVLGVVDGLLDLHGGVHRIDPAEPGANDGEERGGSGSGEEAEEPELPDPFGQHGVLVEHDHGRGVDEEHGGEEEAAEGEVVDADAAGGLRELLVHFGGVPFGGSRLFEDRGHGSSPRQVCVTKQFVLYRSGFHKS